MTITHREALEASVKFLSTRMKDRLKIVDHIPGLLCASTEIYVEKCWIVHVQHEKMTLDGEEQYIVVDKKTGDMKEITTA